MANRTNIWNINHNTLKECVICGKEFRVKWSHVERRKCCSFKCKHKWHSLRMDGNHNPNWRGKNVGYTGVHRWVYKHLGKPSECVFCGTKERLNWANKSQKYQRDLNDWLSLCIKCHRNYDRQSYIGNQNASKKKDN